MNRLYADGTLCRFSGAVKLEIGRNVDFNQYVYSQKHGRMGNLI
jgi:hypothetical protein